jgi:hypothetical protein
MMLVKLDFLKKKTKKMTLKRRKITKHMGKVVHHRLLLTGIAGLNCDRACAC